MDPLEKASPGSTGIGDGDLACPLYTCSVSSSKMSPPTRTSAMTPLRPTLSHPTTPPPYTLPRHMHPEVHPEPPLCHTGLSLFSLSLLSLSLFAATIFFKNVLNSHHHSFCFCFCFWSRCRGRVLHGGGSTGTAMYLVLPPLAAAATGSRYTKWPAHRFKACVAKARGVTPVSEEIFHFV